MSFEVAGVVLRARTGLGMGAKMVLLGLAEHAHPDGTQAFPSVKTLARYAECNERTVHRHLRKLFDAEFITRDQRPGRPTIYAVNVDYLRATSDDLPGVAGSQGGMTSRAETPDDLPHEPVLEPVPNPDIAFQRFWKIYPKRVGRKACEAAFARVVRKVPVDVVLAGAIAYRDHPGRKPDYTLNPLTWLNQGHWDDEFTVDKPLATELSETDWTAYYRDQDERIAKLLEDEDGAA